MPDRDPAPAWFLAVFRAALLAFPAEFRREFGRSMEEAFEARLLERRRVARPLFTARSSIEVALAGVLERMRPGFRPLNINAEGGRWGMSWKIASFVRELRFAARSLRRRPAFAAVAVVTIGLGVAVTVSTFSVVNGVLLAPLPYPDSKNLIEVEANWSGSFGSMSYADMVDIEARAASIEQLVGVSTSSPTLTGLGDAEVIRVARLTGGLLEAFRMVPYLGRDLRAGEFGPDSPRLAVLAHRFWDVRFGEDADVVGRTFQLDGQTYEVVGVAPPEFDFPTDAELWIPWRGGPETGCGRGCHNIATYGRLAPGATVEQASDEVDDIGRLLAAEYSGTNADKVFRVVSILTSYVEDVRAGLHLLLGAAGLVLLIACVNVANLLLVRVLGRSSETAVRRAIGAGRGQLFAQLFAESALLTGLGGALGLGLTTAGATMVSRMLGASMPRLDGVAIDTPVLIFSLVLLSVVSGALAVIPAVFLRGPSLARSVAAHRSGSSPLRTRLRAALLVGEVALSALLLIGAGLLVRSFDQMQRQELGYPIENVVRFDLSVPAVRYPTAASASRFYRQLESRIAALPGVDAVGSMWGAPLTGRSANASISLTSAPEADLPVDPVNVRSIGPGMMSVLGIDVVRGRGLTLDDHAEDAEAVAMINESTAREYFPDGDAVGQTVRYGLSLGYSPPSEYRIIGVLPDLRIASVTDDPVPEMWVPHGLFGPGGMTVSVRTAPGAAPVIPTIRELVAEIDPNVPMHRVETLREALGDEVADTRFYMWLTVVFAALAAGMAGVGLAGVVGQTVSSRTREIGLRVALGAEHASIVRLVVREGLRPALVGLSIGIVAALFGARVVQSVVYGVDPRDPVTFVAVAVLLAAMSVVAAVLPARRATRIDPVEALRSD